MLPLKVYQRNEVITPDMGLLRGSQYPEDHSSDAVVAMLHKLRAPNVALGKSCREGWSCAS
jgi:hypothetical protein